MNLEVVSGGSATPEEVAALTAALEVVLGGGGDGIRDGIGDGIGDGIDGKQPPVSPWRWSGRRWGPVGRRDTWRR